jgi:hypothetical protein
VRRDNAPDNRLRVLGVPRRWWCQRSRPPPGQAADHLPARGKRNQPLDSAWFPLCVYAIMTLLLPCKASGLTVWALELQNLAFESQLDKHTVNVQLLMSYCNDCMWALSSLRPYTGSG